MAELCIPRMKPVRRFSRGFLSAKSMKTPTLVFGSICILIGALGVGALDILREDLTESGEFPFQVSVVGSRQHVCEGALISTRHVLTDDTCISRCTDLIYPELITQKDVADSMQIELSSTRQLIDVETFTTTFERSPGSGSHTARNELTVITMKEEIIESNNARIITLPPANIKYPVGTKIIVGSEGSRDPNGATSSGLERRTLTTVSREDCRIFYPNISPTQSCAVFDRSFDTCQVDIGSPMVYEDLIIGIVSVGVDRCVPKKPVIYRQVSKFVPWISSKLN